MPDRCAVNRMVEPPRFKYSRNTGPDQNRVHCLISTYAPAWLMRRALAVGRGFHETFEWLMNQRAVRGSFMIMASSTEAVWMHVRGGGQAKRVLAHKMFPEPLVVGNIFNETKMDTCGWEGRGSGPCQAYSPGDRVLDQYIRAAG